MISDFVARVLENRQLTEFVFEPLLELDKPMEWQAGQYMMLLPVHRSYSISSLPTDPKQITLCVDTRPGGPGSQLVRSLKPNDKVFFKGPLGKFKIQNSKFKKNIFIATGTGIGPFKAMIPAVGGQLFWGLRHKTENYFQEFFTELKEKYQNFDYKMVYSEEGKHVTEFVLPQTETAYYLCGNMNMIKDVTTKLETGGVAPENIHFESYF